jgi:acyl-CoA synthetase (AMP-forming)/AMP-acid ligase II
MHAGGGSAWTGYHDRTGVLSWQSRQETFGQIKDGGNSGLGFSGCSPDKTMMFTRRSLWLFRERTFLRPRQSLQGQNLGVATIIKVRNRLRQKLPAFMIPAKIVAGEDLPMSLAGKIDRRAVRDRFGMV